MAKKKSDLIGVKPGGTSPAIAGTRVRVAHIAQMYERLKDEATIDYILRELPDLTDAQVAAAIEYWRSHPDEIRADIARDDEALEKLTKVGGVLVGHQPTA